MLEVQALEKSFSKPLFHPINLTAKPGTLTLVTGVNGSGKTTLLRCLSGDLTQTQGKIHWQGKPLSHPKQTVAVSTSNQNSFFPQLTIQENLSFYKKFFNSTEDIINLCAELELSDWLATSFQKCSSGIRQRTGIARSYLKPKKIWLLDEPFSFVDPSFSKKLAEWIQKKTQEHSWVTLLSSNSEIPKTLSVEQSLEIQKQ